MLKPPIGLGRFGALAHGSEPHARTDIFNAWTIARRPLNAHLVQPSPYSTASVRHQMARATLFKIGSKRHPVGCGGTTRMHTPLARTRAFPLELVTECVGSAPLRGRAAVRLCALRTALH